MADKLELYFDGKVHPFFTVESSFQPNDDDLINIKGITYKVLGRSFTVDRAGHADVSVRCNCICEKHSE